MKIFDWETRLETIPESTGVYFMLGKSDEILYIGKANNLKSRVRQYFTNSDPRAFVRQLPLLLEKIEVMLVETEREALLLEANLIKKHNPRFNVLLKEDRNYLCLELDLSKDFPRLEVRRKRRTEINSKINKREFGPFYSGFHLRQSLQIINRWFNLRTCDDREFKNRSRPCLEYQIKRCLAPCCIPLSKEEYAIQINEVILFLEGNHKDLMASIQAKMWEASQKQAYEIAARYRDQLEALRSIVAEQQENKNQSSKDRDVFALYQEGTEVEIQVLFVRKKGLSGGRSFSFSNQEFSEQEILEDFITSYFLDLAVDYPKEVLLPTSFLGIEHTFDELSQLLKEKVGRKITFQVAQIAEPKRLWSIAYQNAEQSFLEKQKTEEATQKRLFAIQKKLNLQKLPFRIECIDNSHMQGKHAVSAVVVFEGGFPVRSAFRRYHLKETKQGDDFGAMKEVLSRRLKKAKEQGDSLPDLLLIDGGRGQLNIVKAVLEDLQLNEIEIAAIAKQRHDPSSLQPISHAQETTREQDLDRIIQVDRKNPIFIHQKNSELFLLSRIRDEAHKTAIQFHQQTREKSKLQSILEEIPGVGKSKREELIQHFGGISKVKEASKRELMKVKGISSQIAEKIVEYFRNGAS